MTNTTTATRIPHFPSVEVAWQDVNNSFERFCLTAGIGAIEHMLCEDAQQLAGLPHSRAGGRVGHRWGRTTGKIGFHGGKVAVNRPRVRGLDGHELALPTWTAAQAEDWLGRWAMNLMLINVSTRKLGRAVRLPDGDLPVIAGDGTSKSAASRRFVALSAERLAEWMASDLSQLDLWSSRSTACISATTWCWLPRLASMAKATSIRSVWSRGQPRTPPSCRH